MCSEHKNGGIITRKKKELVIGHDIYWQILNIRWEPFYIQQPMPPCVCVCGGGGVNIIFRPNLLLVKLTEEDKNTHRLQLEHN